jgi:isopentenyldiphosphate isomerase
LIAPVAQWIRVSGYEPEGQRFESSRARQASFFELRLATISSIKVSDILPVNILCKRSLSCVAQKAKHGHVRLALSKYNNRFSSNMVKASANEVIWVDENDNELGVISREKAHRKGLLHRIAVIYLTKETGEILIQERMSGQFDHSSAGHVDMGEDYLQAAKRELKEELGIACNLVELGKAISDEVGPGSSQDRIRHIFKVFECQAEPGTLSQDEVKSVFWANPKTIFEEMRSDVGNRKFCGGFKASLKFFLENKKLI